MEDNNQKGFCKDCINKSSLYCIADNWNEFGDPIEFNGEIILCSNRKLIYKKCDCDKCHVEKINNLFKQINDITAMYIDQIQTRENRLVVESLIEEIKMAINKTM